jgi:preprotein translocase subunit SecF
MEENKKTAFGKFHDKYYKILLLIPIIIFIASISYLGYFYSLNNDFMNKDISLTGGTSVTIPGNMDSSRLENDLAGKLDSLKVRTISDLTSGEQIALVIQTKSDSDTTRYVLENYLGYTLTS